MKRLDNFEFFGHFSWNSLCGNIEVAGGDQRSLGGVCKWRHESFFGLEPTLQGIYCSWNSWKRFAMRWFAFSYLLFFFSSLLLSSFSLTRKHNATNA